MPLATFIGKQAASPSGLFGQFLMTRILNRVNINMNRFALDRADLSTGEYLLELGCGGLAVGHAAARWPGAAA